MQDGAAYNHLGYMQHHSVNGEKHQNALYAGLFVWCVTALSAHIGYIVL